MEFVCFIELGGGGGGGAGRRAEGIGNSGGDRRWGDKVAEKRWEGMRRETWEEEGRMKLRRTG